MSKLPGNGGQWYVLAAAVLWGTTGTAQAFAPEGARPTAVGAVRLTVGGVALLALAAARGVLKGDSRWPIVATAFASGGMAAYQLFFFAAVDKTGVAVGTVVTIGSSPILAGLLGFLVRRERPGSLWTLATVFAVVGCILLIATGSAVNVDVSGVLLALGAGVAYATYAVSSKGLLEAQPPDAAMAVVFCLGAVFLFPWLATADLRWLVQRRGLTVALHLGLVATAAAYVLFSRGLMAVPVATAVTLSLAEPFTAATLGVIVLGERLTVLPMLGMGLLLSGLALLAFGAKTTRKAGMNSR